MVNYNSRSFRFAGGYGVNGDAVCPIKRNRQRLLVEPRRVAHSPTGSQHVEAMGPFGGVAGVER